MAKEGERQLAPVAQMQVPVLSQLLAALGPSPLRLLSSPATGSTPVSGAWIHEPRAALPPARHALLLAVGAQPSSAAAGQLLREAAQAGHAGLVIKSYGEPARWPRWPRRPGWRCWPRTRT